MDLQIKTFRIHGAEDEQALNAFLAGKIVRHWATSFTGTAGDGSSTSPGTWELLVAYEIRMSEPRPNARQERDAPALQRRGQEPRAASRPAERREERPAKPPREEYQPQIPEKDLPLYEAVRKWRNARARDERVKPFELFNNRTLEELVKTKPSTSADLKALVPDMEARLWDRYNNELLGFMEAAGSTNGHADAPAAVPESAPEEPNE